MIRKLKIATTLLLIFAMVFAGAGAAFAGSPEDDGPARLPIRAVFEEVGAEVSWDGDERSITITLEPDVYILYAFSSIAFINGEELALQFDIIIIDDRSFIAVDDLMLLFSSGGYLNGTIKTAHAASQEIMQLLSVPGLTIAIVDAQEGFTWTQGFGYADVAGEVPVTEHTLFNLASISKSFTALAVMQLVEEGLIDLDEPVVTYLPDFTMPTDMLFGIGDYRNITPRMLLAHASGICGDIMASGVLSTGNANPDYMNSFLDAIAKLPMAAPEATEYSYANNSYTLLGVLVAAMMDYDSYYDGFVEYTRANIFEPAGMELTTFALEERHMQYLAQPYYDAETLDEFLYYNALPAGGIYSNAHDMARFMHIILSGGESEEGALLTAEYIDKMFETQDFSFESGMNLMAPNMLPGMGFLYTIGLDGFVQTGHPGNLVHYHSCMAFDRDTGLGVFVSVNSISGMAAANALATALLQTAIFEKTGTLDLPESDLTVESAELSEEDALAIAGLYSILGGDSLSYIVFEDDVLYIINFPGIPAPLALVPLSDGSFFNPDTMLRFWFEEVQGELLIFLGEFKMYFTGGKLDPDVLQADDGIGQWIGMYEAVTEDGFPSLISHAEVGVDENGIAFIRMLALHGQTPFSILLAVDDGVYLGGIVFSADGDDVLLEFSGVTMKMVSALPE